MYDDATYCPKMDELRMTFYIPDEIGFFCSYWKVRECPKNE